MRCGVAGALGQVSLRGRRLGGFIVCGVDRRECLEGADLVRKLRVVCRVVRLGAPRATAAPQVGSRQIRTARPSSDCPCVPMA